MSSIQETLSLAATAAFCSLSGPIDKTLQLGEDWYNNQNFPGFPSGPTPLGQGIRSARNLLCGEAPDDIGDPFTPSVPGGQCPGTLYSVTADAVVDGNPPIFAGSNTGIGPIRRERGANDPQGEFDLLRDATGKFLAGGGTTFDSTYRLVNISITPINGPDNCGDGPLIPPEPFNPNDWKDSPEITYDPPGGGAPVTTNIDLEFSPVEVNIDGKISVPVDISFSPNVSIKGNLDLSTGDFNFSPQIDVTLPTGVEDPTVLPDPDGEPGIEPVLPAAVAQKIIGVYVKVTQFDEQWTGNTRPTDNGLTEFGIPRFGSISFLCEVLSQPGSGWTPDEDIKYTDQIVPCPCDWGALDVVVTPLPGVTVAKTVIYGESPRDLLLRAAGATQG